jgi:hypothetical protein
MKVGEVVNVGLPEMVMVYDIVVEFVKMAWE